MAVITVRAKDLTVAPIWATPYLLLVEPITSCMNHRFKEPS